MSHDAAAHCAARSNATQNSKLKKEHGSRLKPE
jgi:hypothetical protein